MAKLGWVYTIRILKIRIRQDDNTIFLMGAITPMSVFYNEQFTFFSGFIVFIVIIINKDKFIKAMSVNHSYENGVKIIQTGMKKILVAREMFADWYKIDAKERILEISSLDTSAYYLQHGCTVFVLYTCTQPSIAHILS